jgi:hypothetical protein
MSKISVAALAVATALGLGSTGCIKQMILDGQIEGTRQGAAAIDGFSDYEAGQTAAYAGMAQFEGMHYLAPDNEDALFMLTKGWGSLAYGYIEDAMEQAEDTEGDGSEAYAYQKARAVAAYDRAFHYGKILLEKRHPGFEAAKKNEDTMKKWLSKFTDKRADGEALYWAGYAWMARVNVLKDDPAAVSELYIGVTMVERSKELDPSYLFGTTRMVLGAYHARSPLAELEDGKKEFDAAIALTKGKALLPKVQLAATYYCVKNDREAYVKTLTEVVEAGDTLPEQRLTNAVAKRRAKRYLGKKRMARNCNF